MSIAARGATLAGVSVLTLCGCQEPSTFRLVNGTVAPVIVSSPAANGLYAGRFEVPPGEGVRTMTLSLLAPMSIEAKGCTYTYAKRYWPGFDDKPNQTFPVQLAEGGVIYRRAKNRVAMDSLEMLQKAQPPGWPVHATSSVCP